MAVACGYVARGYVASGDPQDPSTQSNTEVVVGQGVVVVVVIIMLGHSIIAGSMVEDDRLFPPDLNAETHGGLTINSLTSEDTVPLHTDTDPNNGHCNLWAEKQVCYSPSASLLFSNDTSRRILNGENIGFSYGEHVLFRKKHYAAEGLRRAVDSFLRKGCTQTIAVTKRDRTIDDVRDWFPDSSLPHP